MKGKANVKQKTLNILILRNLIENHKFKVTKNRKGLFFRKVYNLHKKLITYRYPYENDSKEFRERVAKFIYNDQNLKESNMKENIIFKFQPNSFRTLYLGYKDNKLYLENKYVFLKNERKSYVNDSEFK